VGHADRIASEEYNQKLSEERAQETAERIRVGEERARVQPTPRDGSKPKSWSSSNRSRSRPDRTALWIVEEDGSQAKYTYQHLSERSSQVANWLNNQGVRAGDHILLMLGDLLLGSVLRGRS
jgi:hypothetical protein